MLTCSKSVLALKIDVAQGVEFGVKNRRNVQKWYALVNKDAICFRGPLKQSK